MSTTPSFEHEERVRQALQTFDLTLTRDDDVRYLAHGAVKSLELAAAFRDHSCVDALIAEGGKRIEWCVKHHSRRAAGLEAVCESGHHAREHGFDDYLDCDLQTHLIYPIPVESPEVPT